MSSQPTNFTGLGASGTFTSKQRWRMELCIRYELANPGATDQMIADHLGLTPAQISNWRNGAYKQDYNNLKNQLLTGIMSSVDMELADSTKFNRLKLDNAVPIALDNLVDLALQRTNHTLRFKASLEILDRQGQHAKVTRIGVPTEAQGGAGDVKDNEVAAQLVEALLASKQPAPESGQHIPVITDPPLSDKVV